MPIVFSALMCHAPIVIPAVAGDRARLCRATTRAMREVAWRCVRNQPDRVVLISPHAPRHQTRWAALQGPHTGALSRFGHPELGVALPGDDRVQAALDLAEGHHEDPLDHGTLVPLWFLAEAGWAGPTAALSQPWLHPEGEPIGRALAGLPGRTAVIASGDMSHRLIRGAPAGFHKNARDFDAAFVRALDQGDFKGLEHTAHREQAAEDVVESTRVAVGAVTDIGPADVISYEGPWGVGYTEAVFHDERPPLTALARQAVRAAVLGHRATPPPGGPDPAGVFVTLRKDGELRGCIGHIEPVFERLYDELFTVARASALRDPRFAAVKPAELTELTYEVSVLHPPEPISGPEALDPARYGVIVTCGGRRGLLLPDIEGVDTVAQQLAITRRKAGIGPGEAVLLQRFLVEKHVAPG